MSSGPGNWPRPAPPPALPERPEAAGPPGPRAPERPDRPDGGPPADPAARDLASGWSPWSGPLALLAALAVAFAGGLVTSLVAAGFGASLDDPPPAVLIVATLIQHTAFVAAAVIFARMSAPTAAAQFGLVRTRLGRGVGWAALTWVGFLLFAGAWTAILDIDEEDQVIRELGAEESTVAFVVVAIMVTLIAPLVEEFFFRGFMFRALRNWRGIWPAALITGVIFGGIHAGSSPVGFLVPLAVFGVVLCLLYERTGSLLPCIGVHALNNAVAFGVGVEWSWQIPLLAAAAVGLTVVIAVAVGRRWRGPPAPA